MNSSRFCYNIEILSLRVYEYIIDYFIYSVHKPPNSFARPYLINKCVLAYTITIPKTNSETIWTTSSMYLLYLNHPEYYRIYFTRMQHINSNKCIIKSCEWATHNHNRMSYTALNNGRIWLFIWCLCLWCMMCS